MIKTLHRLFGCTSATAAVEAAIFSPLFLVLTLGVTDLGSGMFVRMTVNAAAQSGAAYAVINSGSTCASLTAACLSGIEKAMNDATGNSSFCTGSVCSASFTTCADANGGICFIISTQLSVHADFAECTLFVGRVDDLFVHRHSSDTVR